jgi:hypothetical protein
MGLWPIRGDEKRLGPATTLYGAIALSLVIPSVPGFPTSPPSPATTYVVLPKENHMLLTEAATLDRKSGEPRDLQFFLWLASLKVPITEDQIQRYTTQNDKRSQQ